MEKKPLTIKDVSTENITKFHSEREKLGNTPAGYFDKILNAENSNVNHVNTDSLQKKINGLTEVNTTLATENQSLQERQTVDTETILNLITQAEEYSTKITDLETRAPVEIEKKLTGSQYIFEPANDLAKKMQRAIAYDRKEGKLKDVEQKDYLQTFTQKAINYLLKNEYSQL